MQMSLIHHVQDVVFQIALPIVFLEPSDEATQEDSLVLATTHKMHNKSVVSLILITLFFSISLKT